MDLGGEGITKNLLHCFKKVFSDNFVVVGLDVQGGMLVADQFDGGCQSAKIVDVRRICKQRSGQSTRLVAVELVGSIEDIVELRDFGQHVFVKDTGNSVTMFLYDRNGGLDNLDLPWCQSHCNRVEIERT